MDYKILEITPESTHADIKKSYRRLALRLHPDKNNAPDAAEKFRQLNEAYGRLMKSPAPPISDLLDEFLQEKFGKTLSQLIACVAELKNDVLQRLLEYADSLPESALLKRVVETQLLPVIVLEPVIDDVLQQNVFVYKMHPVPLWHHEVHYDTFRVSVRPKWTQDIYADASNTLHVHLRRDVREVMASNDLVIPVASATYRVVTRDIKLLPQQLCILSACGLPIVSDDLWDVSSLADVHVHLTLD